MKIFSIFLLVLLLGVQTEQISPLSIGLSLLSSESYDMKEIIFSEISLLWKVLSKALDLGTEAYKKNTEDQILQELLKIDYKLSAVEESIEYYGEKTTSTILEAFPRILKLELHLQQFSDVLNSLNFAGDKMKEFLIHGLNAHIDENNYTNYLSVNPLDMQNVNITLERWSLEKQTLIEFATWATGFQLNSVQVLLNELQNLIVPSSTKVGLLKLFNDVTKEVAPNVCNLKQSPHQILYNLYNTLALAELKGNVVLQFSYMLLKLYNKGNFTLEAKLAQTKYEERFKQKYEVAKQVLAEADRSIYRCDPKQYVENVTYTKLTKLLQGYIENEVNLNPHGTCRENCGYYEFSEYNGCFKNLFCAHQPPCRGKILNCRFVDSDMNICRSSNSERRYEYIEYENGKVLGSKGYCENRNLFKVDSWWRYLFWHCSYCLCLCDDPDNSDRYFSLRNVLSDVNENKVVTGVRLLKHNQIIHIQIQQGVLGPRGIINNKTMSWKPVDDFTVEDSNVENNVDYFTMTWSERSVDTDDLFGPPEHVVTGVRLRKLGSHLNLEIRVTPINFTMGKLSSIERSYWIGNDNTDGSFKNPRTEIKLIDPDIPIRQGPHVLNSKHDQFVQFQNTNFDTDAGQNTVPFIDSQPLTSQGFPISGLGLIHRGKKKSGGFIAPKLISYDFAPHISIK